MVAMHKLIGLFDVFVIEVVDSTRWTDARWYEMIGRIVHPDLQTGRNEQPLEAQDGIRVYAAVNPVVDCIFVDDGVVTNAATAFFVIGSVGEVVTRVVSMEAESYRPSSRLVVLKAIVSGRHHPRLCCWDPREQ